jgi:hypothetical protein
MSGLASRLFEQRDRGIDAVDHEFVKRAASRIMHSLPRPAVHDQLADQAVVIGRDLVALIDAGIDAHAKPAGRVVMGDRAGRGDEGVRILGIDAALDGVAMEA